MKTLRLFGVMLLTVALCLNFTACSSDDDDDNGDNPSNPLVGTWLSTNSPGQTGDYFQIMFDKNGSAKGTYHLVDGKQEGLSISYSYTYDDTSKAFTLTESTTKVKGYYTVSFNTVKTTLYLTLTKVDGDDKALKELTDLSMDDVADFDWHKQ